jgi:23S rRNA G2069 N7-methylase RlmK/C1962 C5-methylase RlmI
VVVGEAVAVAAVAVGEAAVVGTDDTAVVDIASAYIEVAEENIVAEA